MSAEERIAELKKTLEYHIDRYYNQDSPEISDYEYDMMMQELKGLEKEHPELVTPDSPTQRVGGTAKREAGVLVRHNVPMLSLQDVFSKEEVFNFVEEMQKQLDHPEFVVEYKIDGLSMSLRYENGELILAETRGDGINFGEDVTANAKVIKDVKQKLKDKPEYLEIRGEVYMKNAAFEKVNETQELLGKKVFANPRNCAAGTLRQLDSKVTKERDLSMFIFNIQQVRGMEFATHTEGYEFLKKQGIHVIDDYKVCKTAEEVWDAITAIGENRGNLAYDIDGAVVKINRFSDREQLGETSKVPRWAIAYKYPPEEKESRLLNIELSVGRTGRITPTAVFEPVRLCGTSVSRATLHNQDFIDDLDIGIGDTIVVYKSGEIIPKIKEVKKEKRPSDWKRFVIPDVCPVCGAKMAVREEGETSWAAEHKVGIIDGVSEEIVNGLRENFQGECTEVGMYLAMARVAHREGYPEIGLYWEKAAYEEAEHAAKFAEMLGEVVTDSTKKNLEMRAAAENGATLGKTQLAKLAKEQGLDAIHDTVHEMARDEARHGKAFEGLLKRYFA